MRQRQGRSVRSTRRRIQPRAISWINDSNERAQLYAKAGGSCFTLATRLALANLDFNILLGDEIKLDDPDGPDPDRQPLGQCLCILLQSSSRLQSKVRLKSGIH
uniref:Uncharacterized protein n=1 Tax=Oryza barthii TaxID=65489 RepID=A0A0D3HFE2_9ORYZ